MMLCCCSETPGPEVVQQHNDEHAGVAMVGEEQPQSPELPDKDLKEDPDCFGKAESTPVLSQRKFVVNIQNPTHGTLGLDVDRMDKHVLMVLEVIEKSIFSVYNELAPQDKVVVKGDRILEVNGVTGFAAPLMAELQTAEKLQITFERCKEMRVTLRREDNLGVALAFNDKSPCLFIRHIDARGAFATWNADHPSSPIHPHDKIMAVDDESGMATALLQRMKKQDDMTLTIYSWHYG